MTFYDNDPIYKTIDSSVSDFFDRNLPEDKINVIRSKYLDVSTKDKMMHKLYSVTSPISLEYANGTLEEDGIDYVNSGNCICASETIERFAKLIDKFINSDKAKFKVVFYQRFVDIMLLESIDKIFEETYKLIDSRSQVNIVDVSMNPVVISKEALDAYIYLKNELCINAKKKFESCVIGERLEDMIIDVDSSIEMHLNPYNVFSESVSTPIWNGDTRSMASSLYDLICIPENVFKANFKLVPIIYEEDKIKFLVDNIENIAGSKLEQMFFKALYVYSTIVNTAIKYIGELQEISKDFFFAITSNEFKYETDSEGVVVPSEYPESVRKIYDYKGRDPYNDGNCDTVISTEASLQNPETTTNSVSINDIDEGYKRKYIKLQKTVTEITKIKSNKFKSKMNAVFYKRWIGRIPSMLQRYGGEAIIRENRMKGDPTQILMNAGVRYIKKVQTDTDKIFNELVTAAKGVASGGELSAKVSAAKAFCKHYKIEDMNDAGGIKEQILNEAKYRIAHAVLQNNGVYGYSAEGCVENGKFPTANHIVVSLFVENPNEEPEDIPVSNIFQKPESLTVFAHPEKLVKLENAFRETCGEIVQSFNPRMVGAVHKNLDANYKTYVNNLKSNAATQGMASSDRDDDRNDMGNSRKVAKALEDGIVKSLDLVIDQKRRCIQCVGAMYDMLDRIEKLGKRCIAALHDVELKHNDNSYKSGTRDVRLNTSTAYSRALNKSNAMAGEKSTQSY